jgi:prophage regulatory protein
MIDEYTTVSYKFTKLEAIAQQVAMGKSTILAWESVGKFPRAVRLSPTIRVWLQQDVDNWIVEQHEKSLTDNAGGAK